MELKTFKGSLKKKVNKDTKIFIYLSLPFLSILNFNLKATYLKVLENFQLKFKTVSRKHNFVN